MPNFFNYFALVLFFIVVNPYIAILHFYFEKNKYYAKKNMGAEKFHNYIIYYADSLRHYWTASTILYYFILLRLLLLLFYIIRTKRVRVYTIIILLYSSSLSSSLIILSSSSLYFIPIHSQHQAKPNQNKLLIVTSSISSYMYYKTCSTCFNSS